MYIPPHFAETRLDLLHAAIRRRGLSTLVSNTADGLLASHVPLLLDAGAGPYGTLIGHFAKANPHARDAIGETLAIFQGADGYITPSWYPTKQEHGKVVPTWNYVAIHAYGTMETFTDPNRLLDIVTRLTDQYEAPRAAPWAVSDAPADFVQGMLNSIVGFTIRVTRLQGKVKMSQNRPAADRHGVVAGLRDAEQPAMAGIVQAGGIG